MDSSDLALIYTSDKKHVSTNREGDMDQILWTPSAFTRPAITIWTNRKDDRDELQSLKSVRVHDAKSKIIFQFCMCIVSWFFVLPPFFFISISPSLPFIPLYSYLVPNGGRLYLTVELCVNVHATWITRVQHHPLP